MLLKVIYPLHTLIILIAIAFCGYMIYSGYLYIGHEPLGRSVARFAIGMLCGTFSIAHIYLIFKKIFSPVAIVSFLPLYSVLGFSLAGQLQGMGKNWAPAVHWEARQHNITGISIIIVILALCVISWLISYKRGKPL